jgi:acyl-ACP thioesterase
MVKIPFSFQSLVYTSDTPLNRPTKKLYPVTTQGLAKEVKVNYFHLDWNGHVNNVQYIKMILESLDPKILTTKEIRTLAIQYKSEALIGQELAILHQMDSDYSIKHTIRCLHTGKDLIVAETEWSDII